MDGGHGSIYRAPQYIVFYDRLLEAKIERVCAEVEYMYGQTRRIGGLAWPQHLLPSITDPYQPPLTNTG